MNNNDYIKTSLELHLFFDRIMKEHSFFLEVSFTDRDRKFKTIAADFQKVFNNILTRAINLANKNIPQDFLYSEEIVTKNTLQAEQRTKFLSGHNIDTNLTLKEQNLQSGNIDATQALVKQISNLNRETLPLIQKLINFKMNVLTQVLNCKMYTTNYPLLINHIIKEAKIYFTLLNKVEKRESISKDITTDQELFWNDIMKEHALFIRGSLDPSEKSLINTANEFANNYEKLINNYNNTPYISTASSLKETLEFRDFKIAGEDGILTCKIKSIIIPLLADHVLREANHFIRLLNNNSSLNK